MVCDAATTVITGDDNSFIFILRTSKEIWWFEEMQSTALSEWD